MLIKKTNSWYVRITFPIPSGRIGKNLERLKIGLVALFTDQVLIRVESTIRAYYHLTNDSCCHVMLIDLIILEDVEAANYVSFSARKIFSMKSFVKWPVAGVLAAGKRKGECRF